MKKIIGFLLFLVLCGCSKNAEDLPPVVTPTTDISPVGIWDAIYFKNINYSVGARFEAPKGLTMTFLPDGTFSTNNIPHIAPALNLTGKYTFNSADKKLTISETQLPTQPTMFIESDPMGRTIGRITILDRSTFVGDYELVKRK